MFFDDNTGVERNEMDTILNGMIGFSNPFEDYFPLSNHHHVKNSDFHELQRNDLIEPFYSDDISFMEEQDGEEFIKEEALDKDQSENRFKDFRKVSDSSRKIKKTHTKDQLTKEYNIIEKKLTKSFDKSDCSESLTKMDDSSLNNDMRKAESLALRNIKMNFGTGLLQFIEFKKTMAGLEGNKEVEEKMDQLGIWVLKFHQNFRSFEGWAEMWDDAEYGKDLREVSLEFFGNSFSESYVLNSKIKSHYQKAYVKKIMKFYCGAMKPSIFSSYYFGLEQCS